MTFALTLLSPLRPVVATLLSPSSICSVYSLSATILIAFAWLAWRRKRRDRPVALRALARAIFSRRVLLHRSTFADLAYCVIGLTTLGAILGWAVVSTSWISDGVAALLTRCLGPAPQWRAPDWTLNALRTVALFLAYELGFFVDHTLKHRVPALWELHKAFHRPRNTRVCLMVRERKKIGKGLTLQFQAVPTPSTQAACCSRGAGRPRPSGCRAPPQSRCRSRHSRQA